MFDRSTGEHLCLIKTALALFCASERDRNNQNWFNENWFNKNWARPVRVKVVEAICQQPAQRLCSRLNLLILQQMNQSPQCAIMAAIGIRPQKSWARPTAHSTKHRFFAVLESVYRLSANVAADQVKALNRIDTGAANGKS